MIAAPERTVEDFLPKLEKALELAGDTHTVADVAYEVERGEAQLWVEGDGMLVTQLDYKPHEVILIFWLAAGDMEDVLGLEELASAWGREIGCTRARMTGRKGWARVLADRGWEQAPAVMYEKALANG